MPTENFEPGEFTLHIVLATIPQRQEYLFDQKISEEYYAKFRNNSLKYCRNENEDHHFYDPRDTEKETPVLYNPIRYYLLGNYDIAYISLINNLKFAQRLFESTPGDEEDLFAPHTFQSFTGICYHSQESLKDFFFENLSKPKARQKYFLGICNLKLNNGFLIGTGNVFIHPVLSKIKDVIAEFNKGKSEKKRVEHLIVQSFSWFEFSLLLFTDNTDSIAAILGKLRSLSINQLDDAESIIKDSLYRSIYSETPVEDLGKANVFADTHTYIGLHADLLSKQINDQQFIKKFEEEAKKLKLKTEVEWQVKPGHMHLLVNLLEQKFNMGKSGFKLKNRYLLTGKTDYLLHQVSASVLTNYNLMKLHFDEQSELFTHVRKIRTRVLFKGPGKVSKEVGRKTFKLQSALSSLAIKGSVTRRIDEHLKALKISRQIKSKILKIFSNFNNGIQDMILFPFFMDFKIFMDELVRTIDKEYDKWRKASSLDADDFFTSSVKYMKKKGGADYGDVQSVDELERKLIKRINVFEEAYNLRVLNCYQFEDITDFDLDFNGSVQQLLSAYSSIIAEMGNIFYKPGKKYQFGPVVQLNLKDTQANYSSINYHVHHLISPEFVFATVTKEILNNEEYDAKPIQELLDAYEKVIEKLEDEHPYLYEMIEDGSFDFAYFVNDAIRFVISYDLDFKLFYYWFWMYNLQNPLLYDKRGMMNEKHFVKELFRILLIAKHFKMPPSEIYCPIEELFTYWDRHYRKINSYADQYLIFLSDNDLLKHFGGYFVERFHNFLNTLLPSIEEAETKSQKVVNKINILKAAFPHDVIKFKKYYFLHMAYDEIIASGIRPPADNSLLAIQFFMRSYLEEIYAKNKGVISYLRRDWKTGMPLKCFIKSNTTDHLYCVDQTGGLFFDNMDQLHIYVKQSCVTLKALLHYSLVLKKLFIEDKQKAPVS